MQHDHEQSRNCGCLALVGSWISFGGIVIEQSDRCFFNDFSIVIGVRLRKSECYLLVAWRESKNGSCAIQLFVRMPAVVVQLGNGNDTTCCVYTERAFHSISLSSNTTNLKRFISSRQIANQTEIFECFFFSSSLR